MVDFKFKVGDSVLYFSRNDKIIGFNNRLKSSNFTVAAQVVSGKNKDRPYYVITKDGIAPKLISESQLRPFSSLKHKGTVYGIFKEKSNLFEYIIKQVGEAPPAVYHHSEKVYAYE